LEEIMKRATAVGGVAFVTAAVVGVAACVGDASTTNNGASAEAGAEAGDAGAVADSSVVKIDSGTGGGVDSSMAQDAGGNGFPSAECTAYAKGLCTFYAQCEVGTLHGIGTMADCEALNSLDCAYRQSGPTSGWTTAEVTQCANYFSTTGCNRALPSSTSACYNAGTGAQGAPCGTVYDCKALGCTIPTGQSCGTCDAVGTAGSPCGGTTGTSCGGAGLQCVSGVCATLVAVTSTCDATHFCYDSVCVTGDAGASSGTCTAPGTTIGAACSPATNSVSVGVPDCNRGAGFFCDSTKHCAAITYQPTGMPCDTTFSGTTHNECMTETATCVSGTCTAVIPIGMPCTRGSGNAACVNEAFCEPTTDGGTTGTCVATALDTCH
jgi:hypothetical protein